MAKLTTDTQAWIELPIQGDDGITRYERYPVDTDEQRRVARDAMRAAGATELDILRPVGSSWVGLKLYAE